MNGSPAAGSHAWQMAFVSFAVVLILFQMLRGWSLGLPRQIVRLCAIVAAYGAAFLGGRMMLPFVRPLVRLPDVALSAIGGALLAMIVYAVINGVGALLFKRTAQQESGFIRMIYGASGAFLGLFFGLFFVWLLITGVRSVGSVADAQVQAKTPASLPPNAHRIINGKLLPAAIEAKKRGVHFDVGHGGGSFDYTVAEVAMAQGVTPDTISSDMHVFSGNSPGMPFLTWVMSKFLNMGFTLEQVVAMATINSARAIDRLPKLGTLQVGAPGDATLLEVVDGPVEFVDTRNNKRTGKAFIRPVQTVAAGIAFGRPYSAPFSAH